MFGIRGPLDERAEHEIGRVCTTAFIFIFVYMFLLLVVCMVFLMSKVSAENSALSLMALIFFGWLIVSFMVSRGIIKSGVNRRAIPRSEYAAEKRKIFRSQLLRMIPLMGVGLIAFSNPWGMSLNDAVATIFSWASFGRAAIWTVFMTVYFINAELSSIETFDDDAK
jgi:uncharacterized membrane protein